MTTTKNIVCLANSWKTGGSCFAGKICDSHSSEWIRPVSDRPTHEISIGEQTLDDGTKPQLLDVIAVPLLEHVPTGHQTENYTIVKNQIWERVGRVSLGELHKFLDAPTQLWGTGNSTILGENDQITASEALKMTDSLKLIKPASLTVIINPPYRSNRHNRIRAEFSYNDIAYNFNLTDPSAKGKYDVDRLDTSADAIRYQISSQNVFLCVSLAEEFKATKHCYKLVAAIIGDE